MSRAKRLIEASYNHRSAEYARFAGDLVYAHLSRPLVRTIDIFDGPVLDVAGGTGALTRQLKDATVADLAFRQLSNNPVRARVQADAETLPFADDSFAVAASAFGINHFPDPGRAVAEMARVAPVVGLLTWKRPEDQPYAPKVIVLETLGRFTGESETETGRLVDEMSERVGSEAAVERLLEDAGAEPTVETVEVDVPWPGTDRYIEFRLSMTGPGQTIADIAAFKREAAAALDSLTDDERRWTARLVLGLGRRQR
jgi:SAM-dependent methyltransferase